MVLCEPVPGTRAKYPGEPVAIDALGGLVANRFTPPEAEQAAEILIRDHIKSDKLISLYRQLGRSSSPWSTAAERLFRAAAEYGPTPDARGRACLSLGISLSIGPAISASCEGRIPTRS